MKQVMLKVFVALSSFFILSIGCMSSRDKDDMISGSQSFLLSEADVRERQSQAIQGDADAAYSLYLHYAFAKSDSALGDSWLLKAVNLNHKQATEHYNALSVKPKSNSFPSESSDESPF